MSSSQSVDLQLANDIKRFYADPLGFVMYSYPWGRPGMLEHHEGPDQWQRAFLLELGEEVRKRGFDGVHPVAPIRMATSSGHGIGKSVLSAWIADWIMSTRPRAKGTISATTFTQLETRTWAALVQWTNMCVTGHWFNVSSEKMYFRGQKESWLVSAQSCKEENSEGFAGQHAADSTSFYIFDEASGVPDKILEVAEGGLTDGEPMIFLFGNPTRNTGKFHRVMFGEERGRWNSATIDSRSSRFTNKVQIQEWVDDYGEDSDFVRVRVRGECPRAATNQLIPNDVVAAARKFKATGYEGLPKIVAVDVARFGDDRTVIGIRQGRHFRIYATLRGADTVQTTAKVVECWERENPDAVIVDGDGIGAGVVDQLRHLGYDSQPGQNQSALFEFHGGNKAFDFNKYFNRRAEVWGLMGDWLKAGAEIPDDPAIEIDLTGPQYGYSNKSQIQLEKKQDMKSRGLASPDFGDTLAMTFSVNVSPRMRQQKEWFKDLTRYRYRMPSKDSWMAG